MKQLPCFADPENLVQPEGPPGEDIAVCDDASPLDLLVAIYRDHRQPIARRMRAAIEAAPYFHPKLAVNANINAGDDFARRLERAIARSSKAPLMIEGKPIPLSEGSGR